MTMFLGSGLFVVFLLVVVLVPVVIWLLIESETADERVLDRESAERRVRSDDGGARPATEVAGRDDEDETRGWQFEDR